MEVMEFIKQQVEENPVVIFMKGTPDFPQCGFSARATQALAACGERFAAVNIFENPEEHAGEPVNGIHCLAGLNGKRRESMVSAMNKGIAIEYGKGVC